MRVVIADDEAPARARLARLLAALPDIDVCGEASHGREVLEVIERLQPDCVFLDIEMPVLDGIETAAALGSGGPFVIFVTAFASHAAKAFDANAVDYLLKPVLAERLAEAVERLRCRLSAKNPFRDGLDGVLHAMKGRLLSTRLGVKVGARYLVFDQMEISAIRARDHYSELVIHDNRILTDDPLDALQARLDSRRFLRVHRSALVNVDFISELHRDGDRKYRAILNDIFMTDVPVSRESLPFLKRLLFSS